MNLANHFLVAMPGMQDPLFKRTVVYICDHSDDGAMGIIINAPIDISVGGMLKQVEVQPVHPQLNTDSLEKPVLNGGPVAEDRGFILHEPKDHYQSSIQMTQSIAVTTSKDILSVLGTEAEPDHYVVALGYSGWEAGQLESELLGSRTGGKSTWVSADYQKDFMWSATAEEQWSDGIENSAKQKATNYLNF